MTPCTFVDKWTEASAKESAAAQQHFLDLCRLVGHPTPIEAEPEGRTHCFEAGATKQSGGQELDTPDTLPILPLDPYNKITHPREVHQA